MKYDDKTRFLFEAILMYIGERMAKLDSNEVSKRIQNFIDSRKIIINGRYYIPVDDKLRRDIMQEITIPDDSYYGCDDDFRSRA